MILLAENQTLTASFVQLGTSSLVIPTALKFSFLTLAIDLTINNSKNVQIKPFFEDTNGDLYEFPLESVKINKVTVIPLFKELDNDVDQRILVEFGLDNTIDLVQIQVRAGILGVTPGVINKAQFNLGYRQ